MKYFLTILLSIITNISLAQESCDTTSQFKHNILKYREIQCDGSLWVTVEEFDKKGQLSTRYFKQEKIKRENSRRVIWHYKIDSVYTEYYENYPITQISFKDGNYDGTYIYFFPLSNDTQLVYLYKNDRLLGLEKEYFKNGNLKQAYKYRNDSIISAQTYDTSGNLLGGTVLEKGNGYITFCSEDGTICCRCAIIDNKVKNCQPLAKWEEKNKRKKGLRN